LAAHH